MSGKQGTCRCCQNFREGLYSLRIQRGWTDDKHDIDEFICEDCVDLLVDMLDAKKEI